jgi:hypothetical protein
MTFNTGLSKLKAEIETLEDAIGKADPEPMIVYCVNDPERRHAGPDEVEIGGET